VLLTAETEVGDQFSLLVVPTPHGEFPAKTVVVHASLLALAVLQRADFCLDFYVVGSCTVLGDVAEVRWFGVGVDVVVTLDGVRFLPLGYVATNKTSNGERRVRYQLLGEDHVGTVVIDGRLQRDIQRDGTVGVATWWHAVQRRFAVFIQEGHVGPSRQQDDVAVVHILASSYVPVGTFLRYYHHLVIFFW
jgi:aspartate 1-decarboxylase